MKLARGPGAELAFPTNYRVMKSAACTASGVQGRALAAKRFSCIVEVPHGLPLNLLAVKFGWGGMAHLARLESVYDWTSWPRGQTDRLLDNPNLYPRARLITSSSTLLYDTNSLN